MRSNIDYFAKFATDTGLVRDVVSGPFDAELPPFKYDETRIEIYSLSKKNFEDHFIPVAEGALKQRIENMLERDLTCDVGGSFWVGEDRRRDGEDQLLWSVLIVNSLDDRKLSSCIKQMLFHSTGLIDLPESGELIVSSSYSRKHAPKLPKPVYIGYTDRERLMLKIFARDAFRQGQSYEEADKVAEEIITTECAAHR